WAAGRLPRRESRLIVAGWRYETRCATRSLNNRSTRRSLEAAVARRSGVRPAVAGDLALRDLAHDGVAQAGDVLALEHFGAVQQGVVEAGQAAERPSHQAAPHRDDAVGDADP